MKGLVIRWLISAVSLLVVSHVVPGFHVQSFMYALLAALFLGILNAVVRPVLIILTLPLTIFTLGLFLLIINGFMLWLLSGMIKGIYIESFGSAFLGALILKWHRVAGQLHDQRTGSGSICRPSQGFGRALALNRKEFREVPRYGSN